MNRISKSLAATFMSAAMLFASAAHAEAAISRMVSQKSFRQGRKLGISIPQRDLVLSRQIRTARRISTRCDPSLFEDISIFH